MELKDVIFKRSSVRSYENKPVTKEKLLRIIEAARLAPSGSNRQPWKFIVVRDAEIRQQLAAAAGQTFIVSAPVIIAAVATAPRLSMGNGVPEYAVDLAIAVDHMTLAAVDEELGTCWIGAFSQEKAKAILNIPENYKIVAMLTLGFPKQQKRPKIRKPLDQILYYESFEE
jgi:nitroreductase